MKHPLAAVLIYTLVPILASAQNIGDTPPSSNSSSRPQVTTTAPVQNQAAPGPQGNEPKNDADSAPHFGRLAPEQIQAIQSVGKNVLGAKSSRVPSAALSAARAELDALRATVEKMQSVATAPSLTTTPQGAASIPNANLDKERKARRMKEDQDIDRHLQSLRARHAELDAHAAAINTSDTEKSLERGASNTLRELEQELATALAATDSERFVKLSALRQRLQVKTMGDLFEERRMKAAAAGTPEEDTPTLTTIVQHR